jgi:four helix bundle protein
MAGVYRFEDLRVWQAAKQQSDRVGVLLKRPAFQRDREMSGQMNDAAISVLFNITEGFLRRRDSETAQFLRYAFASNGELKSGYYASEGRNYLSSSEAADLIGLNEGIARMLRRWQGTLKTDNYRRRDDNESTTKNPRRTNPSAANTARRTKDQGRTKDEGRTKDQGRTKDEGRTKDQGRTENQGPRTKDTPSH